MPETGNGKEVQSDFLRPDNGELKQKLWGSDVSQTFVGFKNLTQKSEQGWVK